MSEDRFGMAGVAGEPAGSAGGVGALVGPLLEAVTGTLGRFVVFASDAQAVAVALWVAHTHVFDAFDSTPFLAVTSPERRSGKTRLLDVIELLAARTWRAITPTEAVVFRKIEKARPTLLLDEADAIFGPRAEGAAEGLRALLNAGNRRGTTVPRCVGEGSKLEVRDFSVFCPKALAGIGKLPDTVADRSIPIRLQRRARGERVERFRSRDAEAELAPLRDALTSWARVASRALEGARPDIPEQLNDRAADGWEPLLAVADLAGGDWPARARSAALELHGSDPAADDGIGVLLLGHIREVFTAAGVERIGTETLLRSLAERDDGPWADWWAAELGAGRTKGPAARLARMLKPYGLAPEQLRVEGDKTRGYARSGFAEVWERYCPPAPGEKDGTTVHRSSEALFAGNGYPANTGPDQARTVVPTFRAPGAPEGRDGASPPPPAGSMWDRNQDAETVADRAVRAAGWRQGRCQAHPQAWPRKSDLSRCSWGCLLPDHQDDAAAVRGGGP